MIRLKLGSVRYIKLYQRIEISTGPKIITIFIFPIHQKIFLIIMVTLHELNLILLHEIVARCSEGNKKL